MGLGAEVAASQTHDSSSEFFGVKRLCENVIGTQEASSVEVSLIHGGDHKNFRLCKFRSEAHVLDHVESAEAGDADDAGPSGDDASSADAANEEDDAAPSSDAAPPARFSRSWT